MAKFSQGAATLLRNERKAPGLPPRPDATTEPEIVGGVYGDEPRMIVPDALAEDYQNASYQSGLPYRSGWPSRDDANAASRGLIVAALLVFIAVAALLGVAVAV